MFKVLKRAAETITEDAWALAVATFGLGYAMMEFARMGITKTGTSMETGSRSGISCPLLMVLE